MTVDLFEGAADAESIRFDKLRAGVLAALRAPWGDSPPRIAEPSDAAKIAFADAFARSSKPRQAL